MLNESQQKPKPRRRHSTCKKKTGYMKDKANDVQIEAKEQKKNKKKSTSTTQEDSTQGNTHTSGSQGARGVA